MKILNRLHFQVHLISYGYNGRALLIHMKRYRWKQTEKGKQVLKKIEECQGSWRSLSLSCLFLHYNHFCCLNQQHLCHAHKDLSSQDTVCLSEELKTNTFIKSLDLNCRKLKTHHKRKKKRDFHREQTTQLDPEDPEH